MKQEEAVLIAVRAVLARYNRNPSPVREVYIMPGGNRVTYESGTVCADAHGEEEAVIVAAGQANADSGYASRQDFFDGKKGLTWCGAAIWRREDQPAYTYAHISKEAGYTSGVTFKP